ncbi:MAG: zinc-binding dehydrogenase, partial [Actinomycetota bacterium]|nr:zinc-binding dehydrogenase [Actinomycetota bacterium]
VHVCRTRARIGPGDRVAVIGAGGGVGIHMVQVARLLGGRVAGLDLSDEKLAAIEEHGGIGVRSDDMSSLDPRLWDEGRPTVVIDLVGSADSLQWGAAALAMGGRLLVLTTFRDRTLTVDPREMVFREIAVIGTRYASRAEIALAAELVATGRIAPVIGSVVGPQDVPAVHDALREGRLLGRGALQWGDQPAS